MNQSRTTLRPNRRHVQFWFAAVSIASLALTTFFVTVDQTASLVLFLLFSVLIAICGRLLLRARCRYNDDQIEFRYFRTIERKWNDVAAWSIIGGQRLCLCIRFYDGVIINSNQWLLNDAEILQLIPILTDKVGDPKIDADRVRPWPINILAWPIARKANGLNAE